MVPKYSMSASGGNSFSIVLNVVLWLVVIGICFLIYRFVSRLFGKSSADKAVSDHTDTILKHSSDRMSNGNTYMEASVWLSKELHRPLFDIFKDVNEERVGAFMLSVRKEEFRQLDFTYTEYRKSSTSWFENWSSGSNSLLDDLSSCFNKSEMSKYLSHLL